MPAVLKINVLVRTIYNKTLEKNDSDYLPLAWLPYTFHLQFPWKSIKVVAFALFVLWAGLIPINSKTFA